MIELTIEIKRLAESGAETAGEKSGAGIAKELMSLPEAGYSSDKKLLGIV